MTESKDWEKKLMTEFCVMFERAEREDGENGTYWVEKMEVFIQKLLQDERDKWQLKNAGFYRQLFGEMEKGEKFTAEELWKIFDGYSPLDPKGLLKNIASHIRDTK